MVFAAVLRDPALVYGGLHPAGEAVGRAGDVQLDPAAVFPAVARPLARAVRRLPAGVQALLLAAHHRRDRAWLGRRIAGEAADGRRRPDRIGILFPPFPRHPAVGLGVRNAASAAAIDQRIGASRGGSRSGADWIKTASHGYRISWS